jgi:hypothetical protein
LSWSSKYRKFWRTNQFRALQLSGLNLITPQNLGCKIPADAGAFSARASQHEGPGDEYDELKKISALDFLRCHRGMTWVNGHDMFTLLIFVKYKVMLACLWSFKVLNFSNYLTLIVINTIYCANIFPLPFKDNHTGSLAHIDINIILPYLTLYVRHYTNGIPQI